MLANMKANRKERRAIQIEPTRTITLVPKTNAEYLNEQELADYREYRREFVQWLIVITVNSFIDGIEKRRFSGSNHRHGSSRR